MASRKRRGARAVTAIVGALALGVVAAPRVGAATGPTVVASGLDNPRGIAIGPDGTIWVAEAGKGGSGPCQTGPEGDEVCFGLTGALTRIANGKQERVVSGLPSIAATDGTSAAGPEDVSIDNGPQGGTYLLMGFGGSPADRAGLPAGGEAMGKLHKLVDGKLVPVADLTGYEGSQNPDNGQPGSEVDSNPKGLLSVYGQQFIADAGGNDLIHRDTNGHLSTLAVFDVRMADAPPFLKLPPGTKIPWQSVPTSVALGPDGALYIGQLTGFPFTKGGARVFRWAADGVTVYASGFTNILDVAFGPDGSLYVLEIAKDGLLAAGDELPAGRLVRVKPDGSQSVVAEEGLQAPTSVAIAGGAAYVSNCGVCPGGGQVLRYSLS